MQQHLIPAGADAVQCADHAAQHAVFIADVLRLQAGDPVGLALPADDGIIISIRRGKVAVQRVLRPLQNGLLHAGGGGKVHICHPHGDGVKPLFRGGGRKTGA